MWYRRLCYGWFSLEHSQLMRMRIPFAPYNIPYHIHKNNNYEHRNTNMKNSLKEKTKLWKRKILFNQHWGQSRYVKGRKLVTQMRIITMRHKQMLELQNISKTVLGAKNSRKTMSLNVNLSDLCFIAFKSSANFRVTLKWTRDEKHTHTIMWINAQQTAKPVIQHQLQPGRVRLGSSQIGRQS